MTTETETETTETQTTRGKVYVIDRGRPKLRAGQGLLTGLDVVFRHFRDALMRKLEKPSQQTGVFTVQYPEERLKLPEAFRNFPILLYDDETGHELCTSCFQCQRICPPQVIHMTQARDPATGKAVPAVAEFLIEYDACMSCGLCAEVCPFDAIKMDHEFELSTDVHGGLTINKVGLNRPISYYEKIAPTFWAEVKDGAMKKLQGNIKRRPDLIGVAPQMIDTIKAKRAEAATAQEPAPTARDSVPTDKADRLAAIRAKAAAKDAEAQPAPSDDSAPTDKAARLAAIRAANAARKAAAEGAPAPASDAPATHAAPAPDAPPAARSMPDDKAARLAAIRAANAARKAAAEGAPAPASDVPTAHAAPASDAPPAASSMPDDKAARLAAIRAANAAKKAAAQKQDGNDDK
ncbi:MAG: 4Fe-4S binding protein [Roseiflexus sp.]|jgi:Formate hydrogenlyase subunit 6/NADH:ubiquinone oxidoreductase 23 kD subunit (chain I)|nr:4Fe-4S binding protein [Roseiflexus sp.]MBO9364317.1 4Fe-4S binding protein [Roseiflexus sp.]MBO9384383.1 4Fe-4S binding protein [Roseiflexus sp.]MBO9388187.1 4Fe-4S binding protein [Roseiflexus sp.]